MVNDPAYFYSHSRGILIYLIDKKQNKKFAFYKHFLQPYELLDSHEEYIFKTFNQEDKQIDTLQTGLPMNILQIILMECDSKLPTTIPNYRLFSEDEKNEMRKYNGSLPEDSQPVEEEMKVREELPRLEPIIRRLARRGPRLVNFHSTVLEPHGEDVIESEIEEEVTEEYLEESKLRLEISREELEKQIVEHLTFNSKND